MSSRGVPSKAAHDSIRSRFRVLQFNYSTNIMILMIFMIVMIFDASFFPIQDFVCFSLHVFKQGILSVSID